MSLCHQVILSLCHHEAQEGNTTHRENCCSVLQEKGSDWIGTNNSIVLKGILFTFIWRISRSITHQNNYHNKKINIMSLSKEHTYANNFFFFSCLPVYLSVLVYCILVHLSGSSYICQHSTQPLAAIQLTNGLKENNARYVSSNIKLSHKICRFVISQNKKGKTQFLFLASIENQEQLNQAVFFVNIMINQSRNTFNNGRP